MTKTALPTEERPIRLDPELSECLDETLSKYKGKKREAAQEAVMKVYHSGATGNFEDLLERYTTAIEGAVADA